MENLEAIEAKLQQARKKLSDMKAMHYSLALTYGSELCAGDMTRQERQVEEEIAALERQRDQLSSSLSGGSASKQPPEKASGSKDDLDAAMERALHAKDYETLRILLRLRTAPGRRD